MDITTGTRVITAPRFGSLHATGFVTSRDLAPSGYSLSITLDAHCAHVTASGTLRVPEDQVDALSKPMPTDDTFVTYDGTTTDPAAIIDTTTDTYDAEIWRCDGYAGPTYPLPIDEVLTKIQEARQSRTIRIEHNHRGTIRLCFDAVGTTTLTPRH